MECKYCGARNDPDRTTCVLCGKTLEAPKPEEEEVVTVLESEPEKAEEPAPQAEEPSPTPRTLAPEEHIRIGELIYAAYKDKEAGSIDDAIMACQGALALNESSAPAHALLGSLYESKGDFPSAIYEYEKVEKLDPGNVANRQKLEELRRSAESPAVGAAVKPVIRYDKLLPYLPYAVLLLVFILVLGAGFVTLARFAKRTGTDQQMSQGVPQTTSPVQPYQGQSQYPQSQEGAVQNQQYVGPGQVQPTEPAQNRPNTSPAATQPRTTTSPTARPTSPIQSLLPGAAPPVITPVMEPPRPKPAPQPKPATQPKPTPTPTQTQPAVNVTPSGDPEERAVQLQSAGKYAEAISAYRDALDRTSDSGRIYQQIAICRQRLGQKDQAIQSYRAAIRSFRDQLAAGRDPAEVQRNIRACEAGIDALSGH